VIHIWSDAVGMHVETLPPLPTAVEATTGPRLDNYAQIDRWLAEVREGRIDDVD